jgi:tRNA(Ile)-lysidine synthase
VVTRRSHPPALFGLVKKTLLGECGVRPGDKILLAVSGGGDSTALLHVLSILMERGVVALHAHGVDHGLRAEAASELELVGELCQARRVDFTQCRVDLRAGGNLQARARELRYAELDAVRARVDAQWIATAHHADDRAETMLLRLLRGSGAGGLAVLPAVDGNRVRPMVRATKADVLLHLQRQGLRWAEDPSNQDRRFLRSRVRHELMPLLCELSPAIVENLNNLADDLVRSAHGAALPGLGRAQLTQLREILHSVGSGGEVRLSDERVLRLARAPLRQATKKTKIY